MATLSLSKILKSRVLIGMFFWNGELVMADKFDSLNKMLYKNGEFMDV